MTEYSGNRLAADSLQRHAENSNHITLLCCDLESTNTKINVQYIVSQFLSQEASSIKKARCIFVSVTLPNSVLDGVLVESIENSSSCPSKAPDWKMQVSSKEAEKETALRKKLKLSLDSKN